MERDNGAGNATPSCWVAGENAYFGSKLIVSNGVYVVTDRLGSVIKTSMTNTKLVDAACFGPALVPVFLMQ